VKTRALFESLGFQEDWEAITDRRPAYYYDFGNLRLTAAEVMSQYLVPCFHFGEVCQGARSISMVDFEMPLEVESLEQGAAWIAYGIGEKFYVGHGKVEAQRVIRGQLLPTTANIEQSCTPHECRNVETFERRELLQLGLQVGRYAEGDALRDGGVILAHLDIPLWENERPRAMARPSSGRTIPQL
jgi:hypothetical protein